MKVRIQTLVAIATVTLFSVGCGGVQNMKSNGENPKYTLSSSNSDYFPGTLYAAGQVTHDPYRHAVRTGSVFYVGSRDRWKVYFNSSQNSIENTSTFQNNPRTLTYKGSGHLKESNVSGSISGLVEWTITQGSPFRATVTFTAFGGTPRSLAVDQPIEACSIEFR